MLNVPAFIVGAVLLVYWVRVLQMVSRAKKTAGHDANFIPREPLGRILRYLWIPTVAFWVFVPLISGFYPLQRISATLFRPLFYIPALAWIAAVVAIVAFVITWICWRNMGKSWRMGINPEEKT